ncbi:bifunctional metallophosphatase/5'-nucleotidase [Deinococcus aluminii]|uniref:Mannosylglucosyl-3-phosphoglycerate phosphatase n=1 Tax=Deinococcus aluminii TaxID=1656885 RepID=A0ABP9XGL9_9DEIO
MTRLTLLQLNDLHAYLEPHPEVFWEGGQPVLREAGGLARIGAYFDDVRREASHPVLALDCGDTFHGTGPVVQTRGDFLPELLNPLGLEGMTAHWDFAYGPERLKELVSRLDYPLLACNVTDEHGQLLFLATRLLERGGLRVGVIGVACPQIGDMGSLWSTEHLRVTQGREEVARLVPELRGQGADVVVVLSHLGFPQDCALASEVPGINVILSGHTHTRLEAPAVIGSTVLVQAGCHGSFVTRLDLEVTPEGVQVVHHELKVISPELREDPELAQQVAQRLRPFREAEASTIGEARAILHRATTLSAPADQLLTDAVRWATGADLALSNGWRYGAPIPPGPVSRLAAWNLIPHNPPVSTAELTGQELRDLLEDSLEAVFACDPWQQKGGYVKRLSGLFVSAKLEHPRGQRVLRLEVGGEPVDPQRTYTAAYLTRQALPERYGRQRREWPLRALEALEGYLREAGPYTPPPANVRLT